MDSSVNKCSCDRNDQASASDSSSSDSPVKEKKSKISLASIGLNLRRGRTLPFSSKRAKKSQSAANLTVATCSSKKPPKWSLKFNCVRKESKIAVTSHENQNCCTCTCYKKNEENENFDSNEQSTEQNADQLETPSEASSVEGDSNNEKPDNEPHPVVENEEPADAEQGIYGQNSGIVINAPFLDVQWIRTVHEDCDEAARLQRAREIEQGVEAPANFRPLRRVQLLCSDMEIDGSQAPRRLQLVCPPDLTVDSLRALFQHNVTLRSCPIDTITGCHTQVDFIHCLVPDLLDITNCSFYWGKMDRYEAERLLEGKPEGTFLLRDSAQEEFLFSVSFRKYGRSLHARIEQWNHKFSFDSHDPGVYTSDTVCGLIEHYKDPSSCMFFEPMLTWPLHRNFTFPLQHLCRATIVSRLTYDNVNQLQLPKSLKSYLKEYHYRQKVRVERFDDDIQWLDLRNIPP